MVTASRHSRQTLDTQRTPSPSFRRLYSLLPLLLVPHRRPSLARRALAPEPCTQLLGRSAPHLWVRPNKSRSSNQEVG